MQNRGKKNIDDEYYFYKCTGKKNMTQKNADIETVVCGISQ